LNTTGINIYINVSFSMAKVAAFPETSVPYFSMHCLLVHVSSRYKSASASLISLPCGNYEYINKSYVKLCNLPL